jgi:hypothetical protein
MTSHELRLASFGQYLERGEAQLIRVGHALWRDRRKLDDTVSERESINAALESVWRAKREYRADLAKKRALRFSEFRKKIPIPVAGLIYGVGSENEPPKMSLLPKVAGQSCSGAG